jgi:hypothetical protein
MATNEEFIKYECELERVTPLPKKRAGNKLRNA